MVHDYDADIVKIPKGDNWTELKNQYHNKWSIKPLLLTDLDPNTNQHTNFQGDCCASPSRQVPYNKNNSELADVAESETALLPTLEQHPDTEKCINLKGDYCAPPSMQQMEHENHSLTNGGQEEEDSEEQKSPKIQHMLTQEGNKICTQEEHLKWQEANALKRKKSRTD